MTIQDNYEPKLYIYIYIYIVSLPGRTNNTVATASSCRD